MSSNQAPRRRNFGSGKTTNGAGRTVPSTAFTHRSRAEGVSLDPVADAFRAELLAPTAPVVEDTRALDYDTDPADQVPVTAFSADALASRAVRAMPAAIERLWQSATGRPLTGPQAVQFYGALYTAVLGSQRDEHPFTVAHLNTIVGGMGGGLVNEEWLPGGFNDYSLDPRSIAVDTTELMLTASGHLSRLAAA